MKTNNLSFPHPVLGVHDDLQGLHNVEVQLVCSSEEVSLSATHSFFNKTIESLLEDKKAVFCAQFTCPQTIFRQVYLSFDKNQNINILHDKLRNKVTAEFFVVACTDILNYQNEQAHPDYEGIKFNIGKGDVLSYGGRFIFVADKQWMSNKSVSSFMSITKGNFENGPMQIELESESGKIVVILSQNDFVKFQDNAKNDNLYPIYHSCIVFPALMYAINQMVTPEGREQFEERKWFHVLEDKKRNDQQLREINWELENVSQIAQIILMNPIKRVFASIDNLTTSEEED